jgi:oxygen-dependent protoporphyrinogen oxidase
MTERRLLVIGGGIAGLAAAARLVTRPGIAVDLWEADERLGGKIASSPFAGVAGVDEGGDAFLRRIPSALALARTVGLTDDDLTAPTRASAAVWHGSLHAIPEGLVLGVPGDVLPFVRSGLLSWRGKLRAASEPLRRRIDPDDSIGALIRARFGDEVHERLVDALIGSIYAADTDRSSLHAVPQLAQLASSNRSLLLAARRHRKESADAAAGHVAGTGSAGAAAMFAAPRTGMSGLVDATAAYLGRAGAAIHRGRPATTIEPDGRRWQADGEAFDAIVLACPTAPASHLLAAVAPDAASGLAAIDAADVIMVRLAIPAAAWPERLAGMSGYLVPKPDQRTVTAVSFASQKWAHWRTPDGGQILRISLGRDGLPTGDIDDDQALASAIDEVGRHLHVVLAPTDVSVTRWTGAFPQYRPHHHDRVAEIERRLPAGIALAGAGYRGVGIPACIADGERAADHLLRSLATG